MASYKKIKKIEDESMRLRVADRLLALRKQLRAEIPERTATQTLLLATWNIREFGSNRTEESCYYIAEIIDHFDLVVIQEVNSKALQGLERVVSILGSNWSYMMSDGVAGTTGGSEAMAFLYNTNKVQFTGLVGEIVLPKTKLLIDGKEKLQFARTPYMASFRAGWFDFRLCTVHILYGDDSKKNEEGIIEQRENEIKAISDFLLERQKEDDTTYILLGDFNITDIDGAYFNALTKVQTVSKKGKVSTKEKFYVPEAIRLHPTDLGRVNHYDQIAFSLSIEKSMVLYEEGEQKAGAFNFTKSVYSEDDWEAYLPLYQEAYDEAVAKENAKNAEKEEKYLAKLAEGKKPKKPTYSHTTEAEHFKGWRTYQMSDHLPLWVELKIDFSDQYLKTHTGE